MKRSSKIGFKDRFIVLYFGLMKEMLVPIYCVVFLGPQGFDYLPKPLISIK